MGAKRYVDNSVDMTWLYDGLKCCNFTIPIYTEGGQYLLHTEHIVIRPAGASGAAQFCTNCVKKEMSNCT